MATENAMRRQSDNTIDNLYRQRPNVFGTQKIKLHKFLVSSQFVDYGQKKGEKLECIKTSGKCFDSLKTSRELILLICLLFPHLYFFILFVRNFFIFCFISHPALISTFIDFKNVKSKRKIANGQACMASWIWNGKYGVGEIQWTIPPSHCIAFTCISIE